MQKEKTFAGQTAPNKLKKDVLKEGKHRKRKLLRAKQLPTIRKGRPERRYYGYQIKCYSRVRVTGALQGALYIKKSPRAPCKAP